VYLNAIRKKDSKIQIVSNFLFFSSHHYLFGEIQRPHVYAQSSLVAIDTAFIDCPLSTKITFCNSGYLPAKCHLIPVSKYCSHFYFLLSYNIIVEIEIGIGNWFK